ncbi:MAG: hypothetical protein K8R99_15550 [Actinomycetia bacterium]|nr:hypothetical protein [Actinomycetes bacterium]
MAQAADRLIAAIARDRLAPLGLIRKGRSRTWIDDHGWWLINVEFQPLPNRPGCYLNVGEQHLWVVRDHLCFENAERPLGSSTFVALDGDEEAFSQAMEGVATAAVSAVARRRVAHGEGTDALSRLTQGSDDLNAGIASALLGDADGTARLSARVHDVDQELAASYLRLSKSAAREKVSVDVATTRRQLGLAALNVVRW